MIDRATGKPTRAIWTCRYCNKRVDYGVNIKPAPGQCLKRPKNGSRPQPHVWVLEKKF